MKKKPILIVASQRSGTHWLISLLSSHPSLSGYGEIFHAKGSKWGFFSFLTRALAEDPELLFPTNNHQQWKRYLENLPESPARPIFILMYNQTDYISPHFCKMLLKNSDVIHLVRKNKLRQHVSNLINRARLKAAHTREKLEKVQIPVPIESLASELEEREKTCEQWTETLKPYGFIEISYEEIPGNIQAVQDFLGIPPQQLRSELQPTNPEPLSEIISNFGEVTRELEKTPFRWMLLD